MRKRVALPNPTQAVDTQLALVLKVEPWVCHYTNRICKKLLKESWPMETLEAIDASIAN